MPPSTETTLWIIAGESSGDAYGARLAMELRQLAPELVIRGMGGTAMGDSGVDIMVDSSNLGVVGFVEVFKHLPTFLRIFRQLVHRAARERPDCVVLIDYPGFNMRFAAKLHALGIRVVYYVSPQVWAWGKHRVRKLAQRVDKMLVIFPFEPEVFASTELDVEFVGHPLVEILSDLKDGELERRSDVVALLPGSREGEVERLLPRMLDTAHWLQQREHGVQFVIPLPSSSLLATADDIVRNYEKSNGLSLNARIVVGETRRWLQEADAGLAASGTVTVEAAIFGLPLVVVYRLNRITYWLAKMLVRVPYFTMVNVVVNDAVYPEFLQADVVPEKLGPALQSVMRGGPQRKRVETGMQKCVRALGGHRDIGRRTAQAILDVVHCGRQEV
ncbi:MAG: lipid-A-disaccharide synthase [Candidatus Pacebacteria bacterium]|nr:lipid-A-disaccharide synthase [Candidatus Paceibacterota bacterium]